MTKAEAYVYSKGQDYKDPSKSFWLPMNSQRMDHKSQAESLAHIYHRRIFVNGKPVDTHRLVCFSHHGDSILWVNTKNGWELYNCRNLPYGANSEGNIEFAYDHVLPKLEES